jgi:hypothetical protein
MESTTATLYDLTIKNIIMEKIDYSCLPSLFKRDIEDRIKTYAPQLKHYNDIDRKFQELLEQAIDPRIEEYFLVNYTAIKSEIYNQYLIDETRFNELITQATSWFNRLEMTLYDIYNMEDGYAPSYNNRLKDKSFLYALDFY